METKNTPHWFTRGILGIFSFLFTLTGIIGGYLLIYKDDINKVLVGGLIKSIGINIVITLLVISIIGITLLYFFYKWRVTVGVNKALSSGITESRRGSYFLLFLISNIIGFGGIAGAYFVSDTSIKDLSIDESIFIRSDFDYSNPVYTDAKICENFQSYIKTLPDIGGHKVETLTGGMIYDAIQIVIMSPKNPEYMSDISYRESDMSDIKKSKNIIERTKNTPEYQKVLRDIKEQEIISDTDYPELQRRIASLPNNIKCFEGNDSDIKKEFSPNLNTDIKTVRILSRKANLLVSEGKIDEAIIATKILHRYNEKLRGSNLSLTSQMFEIARYNMEYSTLENVWNLSNPEQKEILKNLMTSSQDLREAFNNVVRGEYYFFSHALTGRGKNLKNIHIPFLFDGEDTLNRAIILGYGRILFDETYSTTLLNANKSKFHTPIEISLIGSDEGTSVTSLGYIHNALGKKYLSAMMPSFNGYKKRVEMTAAYQEYLHSLMQ